MKKKILIILLIVVMTFSGGVVFMGCNNRVGHPDITNAMQIRMGMNWNQVRELVGTSNDTLNLESMGMVSWNTSHMRLDIGHSSNRVTSGVLVTHASTYWLENVGWIRMSSGDTSLLPDSGYNHPNVTMQDMAGRWILSYYMTNGVLNTGSSPFDQLFFAPTGEVAGFCRFGNPILGTFNLSFNNRITFYTNNFALDSFFAQWDYRVSFDGWGDMLFIWADGNAMFRLWWQGSWNFISTPTPTPTPNITMQQMAGRWFLDYYMGSSFVQSSAIFRELTFTVAGAVTGFDWNWNSIAGTFNVATNGRITFNTNSSWLDNYFNHWEYIVSFDNWGDMLFTWQNNTSYIFRLFRIRIL